MKTDAFFYQLFKQLPQTVFELIHQPAELAAHYQFDSVEVKKSLRIDGLLRPNSTALPLYVVEVQFQAVPTFYANLFAKVFCYLGENVPSQDWLAVAIFATRSMEPKELLPYEVLV